MGNYQLQQALEKRTIDFSVSLVKQCGPYSNSVTLKPLIIQVVRSATSIGANYAEANNASSPKDFKNKIYISKKEAAETRYWLRLLSELIPEQDFSNLEQEATELHKIFQKVTVTMNKTAGNSNEK